MDDPRALILLLVVGCQEPLPPLAEALMIVDTDAAVPHAVNRLRVDLYRDDGVWFDSRDIARPDPRDWPVSFSVFSDDENTERLVWVRLRAYPEGRVRDYLGERYQPWGGALVDDDVPGSGNPRLFVDGVDTTPALEPEPLASIDRLTQIRLTPGRRGRVVVVLDRVCAGTMAAFGADVNGPGAGAQSCVDAPKALAPVVVQDVEVDQLETPPSHLATARPLCSGATVEGRVCIPGGAALLGSTELALFPGFEPRPERLVVHTPFFVDRFEVSVGRFRAALAQGFAPASMPQVNDGPLSGTVDGSCTWSTVDVGREDFGVSCLSWQTARDYCVWAGGDLPTEAQFEHMATLASDFGRSRYPWGDVSPDCGSASYGRVALAGTAGVCQHIGSGPEPIDPNELGDITRQGVVGLAGGLGEWMRDDYREYRSPCWGDAPIVDPVCVDETATVKATRGGSWAAPPTILPSAVRLGIDALGRASFEGFRCVYPGDS